MNEEEMEQEINERDANIESLDDAEYTEVEYQRNESSSNINKMLGKSPKLIGKVKS